jgi:FkbM family methyltransferase
MITEEMNLKGKNIAIYGAGGFGRKVLAFLKSKDIEVNLFIDIAPSQGSNIEGVPVVALDSIPDNDAVKSYQVIVSVWSPNVNVGAIMRSLDSKGFQQVIHAAKLADLFPGQFGHFLFTTRKNIEAHQEEIGRARSLFSDTRSLAVWDQQVDLRYNLNFDGLMEPDTVNQYFPQDIPAFGAINWEDEVFCDIGAFDGDTFTDLMARCHGKIKHYIGFEPDGESFQKLKTKVLASGVSHDLYQKGTEEHNKQLRFSAIGNSSSSISASGSIIIDCVALDDFSTHFSRRPGYYKMDIEGAELPTLKGMKNIIVQEKPKLAVCVYHLENDLWEIPLYLHRICPGYQFFIRSHQYNGQETVLYCY